jgi:hypothetical protein
MTVAEKMEYKGTVIANKADSVTLAIAGAMTGATIQAGEAASVVISQVANKSDLILNAAKATELQVTAAEDLNLSGSNLTGLEALTVSSDGTFKATDDLGKVANVTLSGTGSVELGNLGSTSLSDYGITVTATGLSSGLVIGDITTNGTNITVDASGVLGEVTTGDITTGDITGNVTVNVNGTGGDVTLGTLEAKTVTVNASGALGTLTATVDAETVTITGAGLNDNDLTVTAIKSATITGGLGDDTIAVTSAADENSTATFTLRGGLGEDTFNITESADGKTVVTITDFSVAQGDVLKIGEPTTAFAGGTDAEKAAAAAEFFNAAFGTTFAAEDVSIETVTVDTNTYYSYYVIKGDAYIAVDNGTVGTFDSGDLAIKLTGVTELEATSIA